MKRIALIMITVGLFTMVSCKQNESTREEVKSEATISLDLIGKRGEISFPEMSAITDYTNEKTLHWSTKAKDGTVNQGDEQVSYKRLSEELHFLNWIEKTGFTVSQIINTKTGEVKAFWSWTNESGKRESSFVDGTFKYVK